MITVFDKSTTVFTHNGLCILSDCMTAKVTEELNGVFEVEIEYPLDDRGKWLNLVEDNIIKADDQLFRIYYKKKNPKSINIKARHIFYDLLDNFIESLTLTSANGAAALSAILGNTQYAHGYTSASDGTTVGDFAFERKNVVECILGDSGVIKSVGGELYRNNFVITLNQARGADRGVLVAYGKNVQGIEETLDTSGICTRLMPVGKDGLLLSAKYVNSPYINNYSHPKVRTKEFNDIDNQTDLLAAAQNYMTESKVDIPQFNYKIDFVELTKTEQYKNYSILETVYMADTVTIKHSKLNISLKAKVIKIVKNLIADRIEKIELGSFKPNLSSISTSIQEVKKDIVQVKSDFQIAIENATSLITGTDGGNVVITQDGNGKPIEILIMDTASTATAQKVWRWNLGGLGYSSTGVNGPFALAITQDGSIVATFITSGSMSANLIKAGWNGINSAVQLDSTGLTITNGKLIVKNNSNVNALYIDSNGRLSTNTYLAVYDTPINDGGTMIIPHGIYDIPPVSGTSNFAIETDGWVEVLQTDGSTPQSIAVDTISILGYYIYPASTGVTAVQGTWSVLNELWVQHDSHIYGTKYRIVPTSVGHVGVNAYETAGAFFGDIGSGKISEGSCLIPIEQIFAETVNTDIEYHVFIQKYGSGDVWVSDRKPNYFIVSGTEGLEFAWELKAKQRGYENDRLKITDEHMFDDSIQTNKYIDDQLALLNTKGEVL